MREIFSTNAMELDRNKNSNSTMPHCDFLAVERKTSYSLEVRSKGQLISELFLDVFL
jgi:hypothetical protein